VRCSDCKVETYEFQKDPWGTIELRRVIRCEACKLRLVKRALHESAARLNQSRKMDQWKSNQAQIKGSLVAEGGEFRAKEGGGLEWEVSKNEGAGAGEYGTDSNQELTDRIPTFEENTEWTMESLKQSGTEGAHEQRFRGDWKSSVQGVKVSQSTIRFIQVGMAKCEVDECPNPERTLKSGRRGRPILVEGIWRRVCATHYVEIEKAGLLERVHRHRGGRPNGVLLDTRREIGV